MYEYEGNIVCYGWLYYSLLNNSVHAWVAYKRKKEEKTKPRIKRGMLFFTLSVPAVPVAVPVAVPAVPVAVPAVPVAVPVAVPAVYSDQLFQVP